MIFLGLLLLIAIAYDFNEIFYERPQGPHNWRQTDCASLALNYHQDEDAHLWSPRTHHLLGKNKDGKTVGEIPVIYYIVSKIYDVFGYNEGYFRIFNFLLYSIGLFYLFRLGIEFLKDKYYASAVMLSATCSVIVIFYAYSFLPNAPSLAFVFCSWYYIYKYFTTKINKYLFYFIGFISLAALLKITALLSAGLVLSLFILERFFGVQYFKSKLFGIKTIQSLYLLVPFILAGAWIFVARMYQVSNGNFYFSLDWDPIWIMENDMIRYTWKRIISDWGWGRDIIYPGILSLSVVSLALSWIEKDRFWSHVLTLYALAVVAYVLVFFLALKDHDYYFINLIGFFPLAMIYQMHWLKSKFGHSIAARVFVGLLMVVAIMSTDKRHKERYTAFHYDDHYNVLFDATPYIRSLGIEQSDKIIVEGERSHCVSLYLLNNKGWNSKLSDSIKDVPNDRFKHFIQGGAKYLLVLGENRTNFKAIKDIKKTQIGRKDDLFVYKLNTE